MHNSSNEKIYLDYAATTPVDPRVVEAMLPYFSRFFGNPSSVHHFGQIAEGAVEQSREIISAELGCSPSEIIFTSCGTESDNLALRGSAFAARNSRNANHVLISAGEHHAVSRTAEQLQKLHGFELEHVPLDEFGMVHPKEIACRIRPDTAVVSIMYANNEIGTINPIAEIGAICQEASVIFHTDAVQAAAYLPIDVHQLNVDLLSLGAHKFYGPKGVGALYINKTSVRTSPLSFLEPAQTGGGQEFGLRAGTHNVPYIVGMAEALKLAGEERIIRRALLQPMRDYLVGELLDRIPHIRLTGHPTDRLPNHASVVIRGIDGNYLLTLLDVEGFACSSGSACKTGNPEPSEVLLALGLTADWALGSLRITLGSGTQISHIDKFIQLLPGLVEKAHKT